jgi:hypothetical protein
MIKTAMAVGTAGVLALVCAMPAMAQAPAARPQPARVKGSMRPFGFQGSGTWSSTAGCGTAGPG